jgi:hypothetical protein
MWRLVRASGAGQSAGELGDQFDVAGVGEGDLWGGCVAEESFEGAQVLPAGVRFAGFPVGDRAA